MSAFQIGNSNLKLLDGMIAYFLWIGNALL